MSLLKDFSPHKLDEILENATNIYDLKIKRKAEHDLLEFRTDLNSWKHLDAILKNSKSKKSLIFIVEVTRNIIHQNYFDIPVDERAQLRTYIIENVYKSTREFNILLIEIIKKEFSPGIISDLLSISKTDDQLQNTLMIICEICEIRNNTYARSKIIEEQLRQDAQLITSYIMSNFQENKLVKESILCATRLIRYQLEVFITLGPYCLNYLETIYAPDIIEFLIEGCKRDNKYACDIFNRILEFYEKYFKKFKNEDISFNYMSREERIFIDRSLSLLLLIVQYVDVDRYDMIMQYIILLFSIDEKLCNEKTAEILKLILHKNINLTLHKKIASIIIKKMPRPEEVLITTDENGELVEERIEDTDELYYISIYKALIRKYVEINFDSLHQQISYFLDEQNRKFNIDLLNKTTWTIAACANILPSNVESDFFIDVLRDLLSHADRHSDKNTKAFVASNIIYIIGQFPKFLQQNYKFLNTLIKKLGEFMAENIKAIQEMATETFLTVCHIDICHREIVEVALSFDLSHLYYYQQRNILKGILFLLTSIKEKEIYLNRIIDKLFSSTQNSNNYTIHTIKSLILILEKNDITVPIEPLLEKNSKEVINLLAQFIKNRNYTYLNISFNTIVLYEKTFNEEVLNLLIEILQIDMAVYIPSIINNQIDFYNTIINIIIDKTIRGEDINDDTYLTFFKFLIYLNREFYIYMSKNNIFDILINFLSEKISENINFGKSVIAFFTYILNIFRGDIHFINQYVYMFHDMVLGLVIDKENNSYLPEMSNFMNLLSDIVNEHKLFKESHLKSTLKGNFEFMNDLTIGNYIRGFYNIREKEKMILFYEDLQVKIEEHLNDIEKESQMISSYIKG